MINMISKLTEPELNRYRKLANFSDNELNYFNMRAKKYSLVTIADEIGMSESSICRLVKDVNEKMKRLDELKEKSNDG